MCLHSWPYSTWNALPGKVQGVFAEMKIDYLRNVTVSRIISQIFAARSQNLQLVSSISHFFAKVIEYITVAVSHFHGHFYASF